ncbi:MAG: dUTP diphosphatase [Candidatus Pacebacteria bacterium]|jgi:dUTP pyrophosphatase|nr:dUTP diphosphatase [Candidatus Paceibacterota bacterium]
MKLKFKKIHPEARTPGHARPGDAGVDLYTVESFELEPGERKSIPLGIAVEIPEGYVGLLWDKSGLSHTYGIKSFGGVIDSGYRGEIHAGIMNLSDKFFSFEKGQKIIQLIVQKYEPLVFEEVEALSSTERGDGRFGSTGHL